MAEHFQFKVFYVPLMPYMAYLEKSSKSDSHLESIATNFSQNHIPYINENVFNKRIIHDPTGVERVQNNTGRNVSEQLIAFFIELRIFDKGCKIYVYF